MAVLMRHDWESLAQGMVKEAVGYWFESKHFVTQEAPTIALERAARLAASRESGVISYLELERICHDACREAFTRYTEMLRMETSL